MGLRCNLFVLLVVASVALSSAGSSANDILSDQKGSAKAKCENSYSLMCLKLDILSLIDKVSTTNTEFNIANGITLVRESNPNKTQNSKIVSELARAFPDSAEKRLNGFFIAKLQDFIQSYSLKLSLLTEESAGIAESRKGGGGFGGGGGKKGGMGALLGMGLMMKGTMMAMALAGVAALAGKALLTGMMALTLAGIAALKSLTHKEEKKTTYEIISKPVYSHSHSHSTSQHGGGHSDEGGHGGYGGGGGGYGRSFQLPESVTA